MSNNHHDGPPRPMHPMRSFHQYPRPDNVYEHKSSFNFDMMRTRIFLNRQKTNTDMYLWLAHLIMGVFMGTITCVLTVVEDASASFKSHMV